MTLQVFAARICPTIVAMAILSSTALCHGQSTGGYAHLKAMFDPPEGPPEVEDITTPTGHFVGETAYVETEKFWFEGDWDRWYAESHVNMSPVFGIRGSVKVGRESNREDRIFWWGGYEHRATLTAWYSETVLLDFSGATIDPQPGMQLFIKGGIHGDMVVDGDLDNGGMAFFQWNMFGPQGDEMQQTTLDSYILSESVAHGSETINTPFFPWVNLYATADPDVWGTYWDQSLEMYVRWEPRELGLYNSRGELKLDFEHSVTIDALTFADGTTPEQYGIKLTFGTGRTSPNAAIPSIVAFYNNSAWDGRDGAANAADDNAIAPKGALLPGGTATFDNYTSYDKGINGLMIDVRDLPGTPTMADFLFRCGNNSKPYGDDLDDPADDWPLAPDPVAIAVRPGDGQFGADRVTLIWDDGVIRNCWLQVTVLATDATGLAENEVFYVGNAVGESGDSTTDALVNATDEIRARNNPHSPFDPAQIHDVHDFNRDKLVNATDQIIARSNRTSPFTALKLITPPLEPVSGGGEGE